MKISLELYFNFNRRFLRGNEPDENHSKLYMEHLSMNGTSEEELKNLPHLYSCMFVIDRDKMALESNYERVSYYTSPHLSKTKFSDFFYEGVRKEMIPVPFSFIDYRAFDNFKNANNVAGKLSLSFKEGNFVLEGNFVTLPPLRLEPYCPVFVIKSNVDLEDAVAEISRVFGEAINLKE